MRGSLHFLILKSCSSMRTSILVKLREIGWGTEIEKLMAHDPRMLLDHSLVKQPKPLTLRSGFLHPLIKFFHLMQSTSLA
jgi:hypothetical protein